MSRAPDSASGPPDPAAIRSRRRFARRQWARRWVAWRYLLLLALLAFVAGLVTWLVYFSSYLAVKGVDVEGAHQLAAQQIRQAAAVPEGEPLARVDLARIRARVEALAPVRSADVSREWPDKILISVTERTAVAVVDIGGRIRGMDADGVLFRDYPSAPPTLPRVQPEAGADHEALREAARVVDSLPGSLAAKVDHVEVRTVDEVTLVLRDGRDVIWGSSADSEQKAEVLAVLLHEPAQTYDVSVPGQPTTSPRSPSSVG